MVLEAKFACCQEAALLPFGYVPCNKPAIAIVKWRRHSDAPIRMCTMCLYHNIKNRGGEIVRYVEDWTQEQNECL